MVLDIEFYTCVLCRYGRLISAVDPVTSFISSRECKYQLRRQIAIASQREDADIMIQASRRHRQEVHRIASYKHDTCRQTEIHHNTQMSVHTQPADMGR
jgi:hypothetical protein